MVAIAYGCSSCLLALGKFQEKVTKMKSEMELATYYVRCHALMCLDVRTHSMCFFNRMLDA